MTNWIWAGLVGVSLIVGLATGQGDAVGRAALEGGDKAISLCLSLLGVYALWTGLMEIATQSGVVKRLAHGLSGIMGKLFKGVKRDSPAQQAIFLNLVANTLGIGNAATPFGLEAMRLMELDNPYPGEATPAMCMFLIINISSIQIIPTSVIALRQAAGSADPAQIVIPTLIATAISAVISVWFCKMLEGRARRCSKYPRSLSRR